MNYFDFQTRDDNTNEYSNSTKSLNDSNQILKLTNTDFDFDNITSSDLNKTLNFQSLYNSSHTQSFTFNMASYANSFVRIEDCPDVDNLEDPKKYDKMCGIYSPTSFSSVKNRQFMIGSIVIGSDNKDERKIYWI
jgi:hypothetical protein